MADEFDDLSKDIDAAMNQSSGASGAGAGETAHSSPSAVGSDAPATPPAAAPDKTAESAAVGERARKSDGTFAAKTDEPPAGTAKTASVEPANVRGTPDQRPAKQAVPPPANWKGNGKVEWNRLPAHIQQEISADYTQLQATDGELARIKSAIGDRAQTLAASYGSVEQGLQNLFAISDMATKNPAGFIQWFAQQRGLDLNQLVQGVQQGQQQQPADAQHPLVQEVGNLRNQLQQMIQQQEASQLRPVVSEIERFKADPAHPYFNDVENYIVTLLRGDSVPGSSPSERLQNAYEMAVWAHPEIRKTLIENERSSVINTNAQTVARAKNAAGLPTGSPSGASVPNEEPEKTLEAEIARNVARFRA